MTMIKSRDALAALLLKGVLVGATLAGTVVGWAQMSEAALANPSSVPGGLGQESQPGRVQPNTQNTQNNSAPSSGTPRQQTQLRRAAPGPLTGTRSSR